MTVTRGDIVKLKSDVNMSEHLNINKNRPYLVVSNDMGNEKSNICIVVPLTSKHKKLSMPTHTVVGYNESMAVCEQIITIGQDDIEQTVGHLYETQMLMVDACLKISLGVK